MTRIATVAAAIALGAAACGGSSLGGTGMGGSGGGTGGGGMGGGVDRSRLASAVTDAEKGDLCDWFAPMVGGYGATHPCADALITAPPDRATCIAEFPVCTGSVTVGQFQDCMSAIITAQNTCTPQALAQVMTRPDCMAVAASGCFN